MIGSAHRQSAPMSDYMQAAANICRSGQLPTVFNGTTRQQLLAGMPAGSPTFYRKWLHSQIQIGPPKAGHRWTETWPVQQGLAEF